MTATFIVYKNVFDVIKLLGQQSVCAWSLSSHHIVYGVLLIKYIENVAFPLFPELLSF